MIEIVVVIVHTSEGIGNLVILGSCYFYHIWIFLSNQVGIENLVWWKKAAMKKEKGKKNPTENNRVGCPGLLINTILLVSVNGNTSLFCELGDNLSSIQWWWLLWSFFSKDSIVLEPCQNLVETSFFPFLHH